MFVIIVIYTHHTVIHSEVINIWMLAGAFDTGLITSFNYRKELKAETPGKQKCRNKNKIENGAF